MPFYPSDFVFRKFTLPPCRRFGADLRKINPRRGVTAPELPYFSGRQYGVRIEVNLQIGANFFHRSGGFADQFFIRDDQTGDLAVAYTPGQPGSYPPVGDHVISRESSCLSRFLQRDLRRENGARIADRDQNFCTWKASEDLRNVITIGRSFFHPAR